MPVGGMAGCEGPFDVLPVQPSKDVWIIADVGLVVEADKFVFANGPIDGKYYYGKNNTDKQLTPIANPFSHFFDFCRTRDGANEKSEPEIFPSEAFVALDIFFTCVLDDIIRQNYTRAGFIEIDTLEIVSDELLVE